MTLEQAIAMLDIAAASAGNSPSRINSGISELQAIEIIRKGLSPRVVDSEGQLIPIFEKRVHQVCKNQVRPTY